MSGERQDDSDEECDGYPSANDVGPPWGVGGIIDNKYRSRRGNCPQHNWSFSLLANFDPAVAGERRDDIFCRVDQDGGGTMTSGGGCQMKDAEAVIGCREAKNTTGWRGRDIGREFL